MIGLTERWHRLSTIAYLPKARRWDARLGKVKLVCHVQPKNISGNDLHQYCVVEHL